MGGWLTPTGLEGKDDVRQDKGGNRKREGGSYWSGLCFKPRLKERHL